MTIAGLLIAVAWSGPAGQPDRVPSPSCWAPAAWARSVLGQDAGGLDAYGARTYPQVTVRSPRLTSTPDGLYLGDLGHLSRYRLEEDELVTLWDAGERSGAFVFRAPWYAWAPARPSWAGGAPTLPLTQVALASGAATIRNIDLSGALDPRRDATASVQALLALPDGEDTSILAILAISGPSPATVAVEIRLSERRPHAEEDEASPDVPARFWRLDHPVEQPTVIGGVPPRLAWLRDGQPVALALVPDSSPLPLVQLSDVTALSPAHLPEVGLLLGDARGCVTAVGSDALSRGLNPAPDWCPAPPDRAAAWQPGGVAVRRLEQLHDGRVVVDLGADALAPPLAPLGNEVRTWMLTPDHPWRATPLPYAEARAGDSGGAELAHIQGDEAGRIWAARVEPGSQTSYLQRLDLPFQSLPALLDRSVRQVVPYGAGVAVWTEDPGSGASEILALRSGETAIRRLSLPDGELLAMAGGATLRLALRRPSGADSEGLLLTLDPMSDAATATEPVAALPQAVDGLWADAEGGVVLSTPTGGVRTDTGAQVPLPPGCGAPSTQPSWLDGDPVCASADGARWVWRGEQMVPGAGRWWARVAAPEGWLWLRAPDTGESAAFRARPGQALAPLVVVEDDPPMLLTASAEGLELLTPQGPATAPPRWAAWDDTGSPEDCRLNRSGPPQSGAGAPVEALVDGNRRVWLTGREGTRLRFVLGPELPAPPSLSALPALGPARAIIARATDPSLFLDLSCDEAGFRAVGGRWPLPASLAPVRACTVTTTNAWRIWETRSTLWVPSLRGILAVAGGLLGAGLLGAFGVYRRAAQVQSVVSRIGTELANPYVAGPPVSGELFYGRAELLSALEEEVRAGSYVVLAGDKRIGKSSLLLQLRSRLASGAGHAPWTPIPVYYSMERAARGAAFFQQLWRHIRPALRGALPTLPLPEPTTDETRAFEDLQDLLQTLHDQRVPARLVLLFDEFQLLAGVGATPQARDAAQRLRSLTTELFRDHICWVAAGLADRLRLETETSDLLAVGPRYPVGRLDPDSARRLIEGPVQDLPLRYDEAAVEAILSYSRCHPFLIQSACRMLLLRVALGVVRRGKVGEIVIHSADVDDYVRDYPAADVLLRPVPMDEEEGAR